MTANQINYARHVETVRANQAAERETARHNVSSETLTHASTAEMARANQEKERTNWYTAGNLAMLQEASARSQLAQASKISSEVGLGFSTLQETNRYNVVSEQLRERELAERERSALAAEAETRRNNLVTSEERERYNRESARIQSEYNDRLLEIRQSELDETERYHQETIAMNTANNRYRNLLDTVDVARKAIVSYHDVSRDD